MFSLNSNSRIINTIMNSPTPYHYEHYIRNITPFARKSVTRITIADRSPARRPTLNSPLKIIDQNYDSLNTSYRSVNRSRTPTCRSYCNTHFDKYSHPHYSKMSSYHNIIDVDSNLDASYTIKNIHRNLDRIRTPKKESSPLRTINETSTIINSNDNRYRRTINEPNKDSSRKYDDLKPYYLRNDINKMNNRLDGFLNDIRQYDNDIRVTRRSIHDITKRRDSVIRRQNKGRVNHEILRSPKRDIYEDNRRTPSITRVYPVAYSNRDINPGSSFVDGRKEARRSFTFNKKIPMSVKELDTLLRERQ